MMKGWGTFLKKRYPREDSSMTVCRKMQLCVWNLYAEWNHSQEDRSTCAHFLFTRKSNIFNVKFTRYLIDNKMSANSVMLALAIFWHHSAYTNIHTISRPPLKSLRFSKLSLESRLETKRCALPVKVSFSWWKLVKVMVLHAPSTGGRFSPKRDEVRVLHVKICNKEGACAC